MEEAGGFYVVLLRNMCSCGADCCIAHPVSKGHQREDGHADGHAHEHSVPADACVQGRCIYAHACMVRTNVRLVS